MRLFADFGGGLCQAISSAPRLLASVGFVLVALPITQIQAQTLAHVRQTKSLRCSINQETPEYSTSDDHGARLTFDIDLCRAVAVAILGPNAHVVTLAYADDVATMRALRANEIDLIPTLTLDLTHASIPALTLTSPILYDAVGLLVPSASHVTAAAQLDNRKICFLAETEIEVALRTWFGRQHLRFVPFPFQEEGEMNAAFVTGNCAALAGDLTRLANTRLAFGPAAARYTLLDDQLVQDPLASASRSDDPAFAAIVRWTQEVLLYAEALHLTQANAAAPQSGTDPDAEVLTGRTHEIGTRLSLDNSWATEVIAAVGNYGEIYARDLGEQSPLKMPRALNRLYSEGGLFYPLPLK